MKRNIDGTIWRRVYSVEGEVTTLKISDVISILEEAQREFGDVNVAVQCRDLGGNYNEYDTDLDLFYDKDENLFLL